MLWVPGYEEIPMSISGFYSDNVMRITVKARGVTTNYIVNELSVGSYLGVKGPLGRGFKDLDVVGKSLIIVGGIGVAPVLYLVNAYRDLIKGSKLLAGFNSVSEASVVNELVDAVDVEVITEDSTYGGTVIDLLKKFLSHVSEYDYYIVSGPKAVLDEVVKLMPYQMRGYVIAESLMKCGLGFCGSCAIRDFLVCRDGPVVNAHYYRWLIHG